MEDRNLHTYKIGFFGATVFLILALALLVLKPSSSPQAAPSASVAASVAPSPSEAPTASAAPTVRPPVDYAGTTSAEQNAGSLDLKVGEVQNAVDPYYGPDQVLAIPVQNNGSVPAEVVVQWGNDPGTTELSVEFSIQPFRLGAGESCPFMVTFHPTAYGQQVNLTFFAWNADDYDAQGGNTSNLDLIAPAITILSAPTDQGAPAMPDTASVPPCGSSNNGN